MIESMEYLGLNRVEVSELVEPLESGVVQGGDGQGREVQEIGVRGVSFREDQVLEGDGAVGLAADPPVRERPDVVLRREWVEDRDREHHLLGLVVLDLAKTKGISGGMSFQGRLCFFSFQKRRWKKIFLMGCSLKEIF